MIGLPAIAAVVLQVGILVTLLESGRQRNVAAAINALVALTVSLLPWALGLVTAFAVDWVLPLWLAVAGLLHAIGMLGPYDSVNWWDHVTHFVSASLFAALVHAAVVVGYAGTASFGTIAAATILFTFAGGLFWELAELIARELGERFDIDAGALAFGTVGSIYEPEPDCGVRTKWYMDENEVIEAANALRLDRLLPVHYDMWKGVGADPAALHDHAASFQYPGTITRVEIGDRVDVDCPGIVPMSHLR